MESNDGGTASLALLPLLLGIVRVEVVDETLVSHTRGASKVMGARGLQITKLCCGWLSWLGRGRVVRIPRYSRRIGAPSAPRADLGECASRVGPGSI